MALATSTTIRDRIIELIESRTPASLSSDKFRAYRDEGGADFETFAESTPSAALRRFQADESMDLDAPEVSNLDTDMRHMTVRIAVAYPHSARYGSSNARDRHRVIDEDWQRINHAIGIYGRANFYTHHDCTPLGATVEREKRTTCDLLVITARFSFYRRTGGVTALTVEAALERTIPAITAVATGEVNEQPLIVIMGQSNAVGNTDWEQGDLGLGLNASYAAVNFTGQNGFAGASSITWSGEVTRGALRPYAAGGTANMGPELAAGRLLYQRAGITELVKFAVSASEISWWLPSSGYPASPADDPDLYDEAVAFIRAAETASGRACGGIIWIQGENDAEDADDAANYQARLGTFTAALRADFGAALPFVLVRLNITANIGNAPYRDDIRAAQEAYVASDSLSAYVDVDDLPLYDAYHYGPLSIVSVGNRCASKLLDLMGYPAQVVTSTAFLGAEPGMSGTGALTPRSRPDLVDGDVEILITSANYNAAADSLTTANGFVLAEEGESTWTTVTSNARMYTRTVTQAVLNANSGRMPSPVVADTNDKNGAKIFAFRSPTGSIAIGDSDVYGNYAADTAISCPAITTATAGSLVVGISTGWAGSSSRSVASGPTNADLTSVATAQASCFGVSAEGVVIAAFTGTDAAAGAVGVTTGAYDVYVVQTNFSISLEPA